jgi:hypothetical protein
MLPVGGMALRVLTELAGSTYPRARSARLTRWLGAWSSSMREGKGLSPDTSGVETSRLSAVLRDGAEVSSA